MITKGELLKYIGGTFSKCATKLGYAGARADNNISRLPDILTDRQAATVIMRMRAKRIKVPAEWLS